MAIMRSTKTTIGFMIWTGRDWTGAEFSGSKQQRDRSKRERSAFDAQMQQPGPSAAAAAAVGTKQQRDN